MAEGKTAYIEYEKEKDAGEIGPTLGIDWDVNDQWTLSFSYQFKGDGNEATTSLGAEYAILENLAVALNYDTADSENSIGLELSGSYALSEPWALTGGLVYTSYTPKFDSDYTELELSVGAEYQITEALQTSLSYVGTNTSFENSADKFVIGAEYSFDDYAIYFEYEIPKDGYTATIGVSYSF